MAAQPSSGPARVSHPTTQTTRGGGPGVWPGKPFPLGTHFTGQGVNFAVFSENAERIELCLFAGPQDAVPARTVTLNQKTRHVWHCFLPDCRPGQLYAYRAFGPYEPLRGKRFNPAKLLLDPYARAITGKVDWSKGSPLAYEPGNPMADLVADHSDDAAAMPKCLVLDHRFDWDGDPHPTTPLARSVIYELHVRGFTRCFPGLDPRLQGTYAGLGSPEVIKYLSGLGVTAVELLPIHECQPEKFLLDRGLTNYWGYNTAGFFAPDGRYSASGTLGGQVTEFKQMVKALHRAGIEVVLDVVYNHTAESDHRGPTLSFRGLDNENYYWLAGGALRFYNDFTGCGNTPRMPHPDVLKLIMDSLRYWAREMHVDGFRFDLASALARTDRGVDQLSSFFEILHQDPVLSGLKLIAEPWDVSWGGYQVGNFPVDWSEWNGRYRDTVRRFWRGDGGHAADMAYRITGSSDLYYSDGRSPDASINFITCHDGFTLHDLVSYNGKHNEANLEENRDGNDSNFSWNCGVEGLTDDAGVLELRQRQLRNFLATLLLSQGTPMITAGDEFARSQAGNNNAYCQDNEIGWVDWSLREKHAGLVEFVTRLIDFRAKHPAFRRMRFFEGRDFSLDQLKDITWLCPDGREMNAGDWSQEFVRCLGLVIDGRDICEMDEHAHALTDSVFLVLLNAHFEAIPFRLPRLDGGCWLCHMDTTSGWLPKQKVKAAALQPGDLYALAGRSMALLEWQGAGDRE